MTELSAHLPQFQHGQLTENFPDNHLSNTVLLSRILKNPCLYLRSASCYISKNIKSLKIYF
uniref:Uncharacterized protein n=1 Tax=Falco tinnunculus TaxID=100819 RepID=A0A8C4URC6_FALTI